MICVGFSTRKRGRWAWLSGLIRKFTKSRFSHAWLRYSHDLYRQDIVVEADIKGIVEKPYRAYIREVDDAVELHPPAGLGSLEGGMPAIGETLGREYDVASLVGRLWVFLGRWLGMKWRNPLGSTYRDCCVENVIRCLQAAHPDCYKDMSPEEESPESLYERLVKDGWTTIN